MGANRRLEWIGRGSPFRLITPAAALRDILRGHGYTVYDIGNRDHLEHDPPEDHTPYSATGYPGQAQYGVGYAIDIMPPAAGARSRVDGQPLPSLQQLGAQLLADRNGKVPGISWLKYMNWEPQRDWGGDCWQDSWKPAYARRRSTDRGHIHLSGLTGFETSSIGAGYDPVARIRGDDDMFDQEQADRAWATTNRAAALLAGTDARYVVDGKTRTETNAIARQLTRIEATLTQMLGRDLVDEQEIAEQTAPLVVHLLGAGESLDPLVAVIRQQLPPERVAELAQLLAAPAT